MTTTPVTKAFLDAIVGTSMLDFGLRWPIAGIQPFPTYVENQDQANERIPLVLEVDDGPRIVWAELREAVDFTRIGIDNENSDTWNAMTGQRLSFQYTPDNEHSGTVRVVGKACPKVDWLILSGSPDSPTDLAWIRKVIADCRAAGVPVWMRNIGARPYGLWSEYDIAHADDIESYGGRMLSDPTGSDPSEWPADLVVRETPKCFDIEPPTSEEG